MYLQHWNKIVFNGVIPQCLKLDKIIICGKEKNANGMVTSRTRAFKRQS